MIETNAWRLKKGQLAFFSISFFCLLLVLITLPRITIPMMIAYIVCLIISPIVPQIMKLGLSRKFALLILTFLLIFLSTYPIAKVYLLIKLQVQNFEYYLPKLEGFIRHKYEALRFIVERRAGVDIGDQYIKDFLGYIKSVTGNFLLNIPKLVASLVEWVFLVPIFAFFFLRDGGRFKHLFVKLIPNLFFERFYYLTHQFNKKLGDYIFAKFIEASIVGFIITLGLIVLNIRFSLLLGFIAGVTNIIPYVGPIIGTIPAIIFGLTEYGWGASFGGIMLLYLIANFIDMVFVFPLLVSKIVDLHPLIVIIGVILGSQYLGIMGMIISIPLVAAMKLIFIEVYNEIYIARTR